MTELKKHNYLTVEKLEELGNELAEIKVDLEILRGYSDGFSDPKRLSNSEVYMSYVRAYKFMEQFFYKSQRLEEQLDDILMLLSEAGNYEALKEYISLEETNLPKDK